MKQHDIVKRLGVLLVISLLAGCAGSIEPPKLSGPWLAGTTTFELNRGEKWMQVRAWYPTKQETENKLLSSDEYTLAAFANAIGIPKFLMGSKDVSRSNINVEIAEGTFPVIIFNHGLMSYARQNTSHFEQLASNGYVVLSLANPGISMVVVRDSGEVVLAEEESTAFQALQKQKDGSKENAPILKTDIARAKQSQTFTAYSGAMEQLANNPAFSPMKTIFSAVYKNNQWLLDSLSAIQSGKLESPLVGHLDVEKIGLFGHSFGSIMSGLLAMGDQRIKAAFGMDAPQLKQPFIEYQPFSIPVCYAYADALDYAGEMIDFDGINRPLLKQQGSCEALFKESAHYNFTDLNLVTPLRYSPMLGSVDNQLMAENVEALLLGFFDTHLKGKNRLSSLSLQQVRLSIY